MTDTLEKPVVDEQVDLEFNYDIQEQCQHSMHGKSDTHDDGPATHWQESMCPRCSYRARGYRCALFVKTSYASGMYCSHCRNGSVPFTFTPLTPSDR